MREAVVTDQAPKAIGPYSQAVVIDGWVFCSGQIPLDPHTGQMVEGDVSDQTRQVLTSATNSHAVHRAPDLRPIIVD